MTTITATFSSELVRLGSYKPVPFHGIGSLTGAFAICQCSTVYKYSHFKGATASVTVQSITLECASVSMLRGHGPPLAPALVATLCYTLLILH
jgi:hypothetical protein